MKKRELHIPRDNVTHRQQLGVCAAQNCRPMGSADVAAANDTETYNFFLHNPILSFSKYAKSNRSYFAFQE